MRRPPTGEEGACGLRQDAGKYQTIAFFYPCRPCHVQEKRTTSSLIVDKEQHWVVCPLLFFAGQLHPHAAARAPRFPQLQCRARQKRREILLFFCVYFVKRLSAILLLCTSFYYCRMQQVVVMTRPAVVGGRRRRHPQLTPSLCSHDAGLQAQMTSHRRDASSTDLALQDL